MSEFESPKLNMAGNSQTLVPKTGFDNVAATHKSNKQERNDMQNLLLPMLRVRDSIGHWTDRVLRFITGKLGSLYI